MLIEAFRNFAERHKGLALAVAALPIVLAVCIVAMYYAAPDPPAWPMAYYIDEETGEVTTRPAHELPPLTGKSGRPTIVRAVYLTASTPDQKFIGYYEKYTDQGRERKAQTPASADGIRVVPFEMDDILIRRPEAGSPWVVASAPEGLKMIEEITRPNRNGPALRICLPE